MNKYLLQVNNISKKFGNVQALNKVNFSLEEGVVYGLLGENGAGKSTLMNILSGIYMPDSGSIRIKNNLIKKLNPELRQPATPNNVSYSLNIPFGKKESFYKKNINSKRKILFESENKNGFIHGYTDNYIRVKTIWSSNLVDSIIKRKLTEMSEDSIVVV